MKVARRNFMACALLASSVVCIPVGAADIQLLLTGYIWCREEKDIAALADLEGQARVDRAVTMAYDGDCSAVPGTQRVEHVRQLKTPQGHAYICFQLWEDYSLGKAYESCTSPEYLTTLRQEVAKRTGDFRLKSNTEVVKVAECVEGGAVTLTRERDTWRRLSMIYPIEIDLVDAAEPDFRAAIRAGCKGVDYMEPRAPR